MEVGLVDELQEQDRLPVGRTGQALACTLQQLYEDMSKRSLTVGTLSIGSGDVSVVSIGTDGIYLRDGAGDARIQSDRITVGTGEGAVTIRNGEICGNQISLGSMALKMGSGMDEVIIDADGIKIGTSFLSVEDGIKLGTALQIPASLSIALVDTGIVFYDVLRERHATLAWDQMSES